MTGLDMAPFTILVDETHEEVKCSVAKYDCPNQAVWVAKMSCGCIVSICDRCRIGVEKAEAHALAVAHGLTILQTCLICALERVFVPTTFTRLPR